ncbi:hypothetical protein VNI00_013590 [Paramarasmius palmivorus]|uniref:Nuclear protein MDM1 n=1 Tax=Paramarasmius palmivorus TaxID=297713 RepID=A0AAW0BWD1_9AGAR
MDTPKISTLREESTPPPSKSSNSGFRLKLVLGKDKTKTIASSSASRHHSDDDGRQDEDEDQEDQLIDDEDPPVASSSKALTSKRKAVTAEGRKRKSRKTETGKMASGEAGSSVKQNGTYLVSTSPCVNVLKTQRSHILGSDGKANSKAHKPLPKRRPLAQARGKIKPKPIPQKPGSEEETAEDECWIRVKDLDHIAYNRGPKAVPWKSAPMTVIKVKKSEAKKVLLERGLPPLDGWDFGPDGPNGEVNMTGVPTVPPPKKPEMRKPQDSDEIYITVPDANHYSYATKGRRVIAWASVPTKTIKVKRSEVDKVYEEHRLAIAERYRSMSENHEPMQTQTQSPPDLEPGSQPEPAGSQPKPTQQAILEPEPIFQSESSPVLIGNPDTQPAPQTDIAADEQPISLESVAIPVYPLPTKPFPVLPPPKISTGVAPTIPLDKTKTQPRHWRVANREIRGIGGGRWFARTWAGEKESEFANAMQARKIAGAEGSGSGGTAASGAAPQASAGPSGKGSRKKGASQSKHVHEQVEGGSVSARRPSKMRISQVAPPPPSSDAGDMDIIDATEM